MFVKLRRGSRSKVAQVPFPGAAPDPKNLVLDLSHVVDEDSDTERESHRWGKKRPMRLTF
jgi:hypothetical protein